MQSVDWKHSGIGKVIKTDESWLQEILIRSMDDLEFFVRTFFPRAFDRATTWQRKENMITLCDERIPYGGVSAYRGFAKTTQLNLFLVRELLFMRRKFVMCIGRELDYAILQTEAIKSYITESLEVKACWGDLKPQRVGDNQTQFSKSAYFLTAPGTNTPSMFVLPKGSQQNVNGMLVYLNGKQERPDFISFDDGEDRRLLYNEDNRMKYERWVEGAVLPCVADVRPNPKTKRWNVPKNASPYWVAPWRVWYQDTVKHEDCYMLKVLTDPWWVCNRYPQAEASEPDENNNVKVISLCPELISDEQCQAEYDHARSKGQYQLDTHCMEKLCIPRARTSDVWSQKLFRYYEDSSADINDWNEFDKFIIVDPAKTGNPKNNPSALLACGVNVNERSVFLRKNIQDNWGMEELPNKIFDVAIEMNTRHIAVETTGSEEVIEYLFQNMARERNLDHWIVFHWIDARGTAPQGEYGDSKHARKVFMASMLLPYYKGGYIYHDTSLHGGPLETQQLSYPQCGNWDCIDCASYVPYMLKLSGRWWSPGTLSPREQRKLPRRERDDELSAAIASGSWRMDG